MKTLHTWHQSQKFGIRLILNVLVLVLIWFFFYAVLRKIDLINQFYKEGSKYFTMLLLYISEAVLECCGQDTYVYAHHKIIYILGAEGSVRLQLGCLGRNLIGVLVVFILAFPAPIKPKLTNIPFGIACICFFNVLRISYLTYILKHDTPSFFRTYNDVIFRYVSYAFIGLIVIIWIRKFYLKKRKKESVSTDLENSYTKRNVSYKPDSKLLYN